MCTQWVKVKFLNSNLRPICIVYVFAIASIGIEREVLIRSELVKSFDCIDQFDAKITTNSPILSKIPELKNMGRKKPL